MPKLSAMIHTRDDAARIARLLDSLRPCDDVLVIDHSSSDDTADIARSHGARVKQAVLGVDEGAYAGDARHDWVLCLLPNEALTEGLEAALFQWKEADPGEATGFAVRLREELEDGWQDAAPETRLVNRQHVNWTVGLPPALPDAPVLDGHLARYRQP